MGLTYAPAHRAKSLVFPPQWKIPWIAAPTFHLISFLSKQASITGFDIGYKFGMFSERERVSSMAGNGGGRKGEGGSEEERKRFCGGSGRGNPSFLSPCSFFSSIQFPFSLWFFTLVRLPVKCLFRIWESGNGRIEAGTLPWSKVWNLLETRVEFSKFWMKS